MAARPRWPGTASPGGHRQTLRAIFYEQDAALRSDHRDRLGTGRVPVGVLKEHGPGRWRNGGSDALCVEVQGRRGDVGVHRSQAERKDGQRHHLAGQRRQDHLISTLQSGCLQDSDERVPSIREGNHLRHAQPAADLLLI